MYLLIILLSMMGKGPEITKKEMNNGLRVIFVEDHSLPIFAGIVQFDVGSIYEKRGITGTSHLLEHMLFKGSKKIGTTNYEEEREIIEKLHNLYPRLEKADSSEKKEIKKKIHELREEQEKIVIPEEIWAIYSREGGTWMNAFTSNTSTQYFVMLPSNKKEAWMKIESDRFKNPVLREFYPERDVVNEERRMGEARPENVLWDNLNALAYLASPVRHSVIGWTSDIMNVTPDEVMNYYRDYYIPENCILVLAGDVNPDKDFEMVEKYFGKWKKRKQPKTRLPVEPEQKGPRRAHVNFKSSGKMAMGFHGPYYGEREFYALNLLSSVLSTGESSILKKRLIDKKIATEIDTYLSEWDGKAKSLFEIYGQPAEGISFNNMEEKIYAVLDSLKENGIGKKDIERAKNNIKMNMLRRRQNILWFAFGVGNGERLMGDPEYYKKELEIFDSITAEEIESALETYIKKDKSTLVTLGEERA